MNSKEIITLNPTNVYDVVDGQIVNVMNPETCELVACIVSYVAKVSDNIFLTTTDSDNKAGNEGRYSDHIKHLRLENYNAVMSRHTMSNVLESTKYTIG